MLYSTRNPHLQKYPDFVNSCSVLERRTGSLLMATTIIKNGRHCAREGNVISYELECFVYRAQRGTSKGFIQTGLDHGVMAML